MEITILLISFIGFVLTIWSNFFTKSNTEFGLLARAGASFWMVLSQSLVYMKDSQQNTGTIVDLIGLFLFLGFGLHWLNAWHKFNRSV